MSWLTTVNAKGALPLLEAARMLLDDPDAWVQGAYAKDADGLPAHEMSPEACRWCLSGAIRALCPLDGGYPLALNRQTARRYLGIATGLPIPDFNDNATHAEVLAALDKAIELAMADAYPAGGA